MEKIKKNEETSRWRTGGKEASKETKIKTGTVVFEALMETVEKPLAKILTEMEKTGALLDVGYLKNLSEEKHRELESLEKKSGNWQAGEFNINSPKQMGRFCL